MTANPYHIPVLVEAVIEGLNPLEDSVIVDATYGGGGHAAAILKYIGDRGKLVAFDHDRSAQENVFEDDRLLFIDANFRFIYNCIKYYSKVGIDGLFADLGVSSHQLDTADRGFSIRKEGVLDMRMNRHSSLTAQQVVNDFSEERLLRMFKTHADLPRVNKVVRTICTARQAAPIQTTQQLVQLLQPIAPPNKQNQFLAQAFQAIRIEVNDELSALTDLLEQSVTLIKKGGRLVVMAYHSAEDRAVKHFMKTGNVEGTITTDLRGVAHPPFRLETKKPIVPTPEEVARNPRARSAKLRIATRL